MTYYYAIILPGNHVVTGWNDQFNFTTKAFNSF